jgi:hypothetical protein
MTIDGVAQILLLRGTLCESPRRAPLVHERMQDQCCACGSDRTCGLEDPRRVTASPKSKGATRREIALAATIELTVRKDLKFSVPRAETPTHFVTMGLNEDLDEAARMATREMVA